MPLAAQLSHRAPQSTQYPYRHGLLINLKYVVNLVTSAAINAIPYRAIAKITGKNRTQRNTDIEPGNAQIDANNQALAQRIEQTKQEIFVARLFATILYRRSIRGATPAMIRSQREAQA